MSNGGIAKNKEKNGRKNPRLRKLLPPEVGARSP